MAPEQARGDPVVASDLYSLGCVLYEMCTGRLPFLASSALGYIVRHTEALPEPPSRHRDGLPPEWDELILALLEKRPADRPSTAAEVRARLAALEEAAAAASDEKQKETRKARALYARLAADIHGLRATRPPLPAAAPGVAAPGPKRKTPAWRLVAITLAAAALAAAAIAWPWWDDLFQDPPPAISPYGRGVALMHEPSRGECIDTNWQGAKFRSEPQHMNAFACTGRRADGQVLEKFGIDGAGFDDFVSRAPEECANRSRELVEGMADAVPYALTPTREGWRSGTRRAVCIVFSRNDAGFRAPLRPFRNAGDDFSLTSAAVGDCFDAEKSGSEYDLTSADCRKPHDQQVIAWVPATEGESYDQALGTSLRRCEDIYYEKWNDADTAFSRWDDASEFERGFRFMMCTVESVDGGRLPPGRVGPD